MGKGDAIWGPAMRKEIASLNTYVDSLERELELTRDERDHLEAENLNLQRDYAEEKHISGELLLLCERLRSALEQIAEYADERTDRDVRHFPPPADWTHVLELAREALK